MDQKREEVEKIVNYIAPLVGGKKGDYFVEVVVTKLLNGETLSDIVLAHDPDKLLYWFWGFPWAVTFVDMARRIVEEGLGRDANVAGGVVDDIRNGFAMFATFVRAYLEEYNAALARG